MNDTWSQVYQLAESYRQRQQWDKAAITFQKAIELRPDFFWSWHNLGDALAKLQQWDKAAKVYDRAVEIDPNFFWSWHNLGDALTKLQQWDKAAKVYDRAVKIDPNFFWSWHNLGDALTKLQQWDKAAKVYDRAVEIDPNFFWSWHNLGDALTKLQQWDKAIAIYFQALILQPDYQLVYQKLGTLFKQRGSLEESIQYYRRIIQARDRDYIYNTLQKQPAILLDIADCLVAQHQINAAIVVYYMLLEIKPSSIKVLTKLAQLLEQKETLDRDIASRQQNIESELIQRQGINKKLPQRLENISGKIIIQQDRSVSANILEALCHAVGWSPRPLDKVQKSLDNSFCIVTVWYVEEQTEDLIGFGRAVCDGAFYAVLLDILVHPHFQNRGLGKKIVRALIKKLQNSEIHDVTLFASPHIVDFYHKLGFISQPNNLQWMLFSDR